MKKIAIVSKIIIGIEPTLYGFNDEGRLFKKSFSKRLADKLTEAVQNNNLNYEVVPDPDYYRNIKDLTVEYDLLLLSPYIVDRIDFTGVSHDMYYILSIEEFERGKTDKILSFLENLGAE